MIGAHASTLRPITERPRPEEIAGAQVAPPDPHALARQLVNLRRVKACPYFEPRSDCGCGVNACRVNKGPKGDGLVVLADCLACLDAEV